MLSYCFEYLKLCDELWAFNVKGISNGMKKEINVAKALKIKVRIFKISPKCLTSKYWTFNNY